MPFSVVHRSAVDGCLFNKDLPRRNVRRKILSQSEAPSRGELLNDVRFFNFQVFFPADRAVL